jgi:microcystin-dependent protein
MEKDVENAIRIPTGIIVAFYGKDAPIGWMLCDGSTIPIEYETLRKLVGNKVPDLRGTFLRGSNNGRNDGRGDVDISRSLGSYQNDTFSSHRHIIKLQGASGNNAFVNRNAAWGYDDWHGTESSADTTEQGGEETRPRNIAVNFIIKI